MAENVQVFEPVLLNLDKGQQIWPYGITNEALGQNSEVVKKPLRIPKLGIHSGFFDRGLFWARQFTTRFHPRSYELRRSASNSRYLPCFGADYQACHGGVKCINYKDYRNNQAIVVFMLHCCILIMLY